MSAERSARTVSDAEGVDRVRALLEFLLERERTVSEYVEQSVFHQVVLHFGKSVLRLPAFTEPHLHALCSGAPVRSEDLPPGLDDRGKLVLMRRLLREGLLDVLDWAS